MNRGGLFGRALTASGAAGRAALMATLALAPCVWASKHPLPRITFVRDWARFPAIVERDSELPIAALGDVHGGYDRLVYLLTKGGIIKPDPTAPVKYSWAGGKRLFVCTGDLIDKGDHSIPVLDLFMALEKQAAAAGGAVIVSLGNHEAEFLAKPIRKKATKFDEELDARGIDPEDLRSDKTPYGVYLMTRPLATRINGWLFAHGGATEAKTIPQLAEAFRKAVDAGEWGSYTIVGERSILEDQKWWRRPEELDNNLQALGVAHIVFGHDPGATTHVHGGAIGQAAITPRYDGKIFPIDVGMSPAIDLSHGALLLIERQAGQEIASVLTAEGTRTEIWRGPILRPR